MKHFNISNNSGISADLTNYGGRIMRLFTPDANGRSDDIVLGYDKPGDYRGSNEKYYGATIGRYGNRIGNAKFSIAGKEYVLAKNNGPNSLHGGINGFHSVLWDARQPDRNTLELSYFSPDMEEGFPGNLKVRVIYRLTDDNDLVIEYFASTDKTTVVNLTHHSFFNLTGNPLNPVSSHILQIPADYYTPVDQNLIPTGEIADVTGTPFDFRIPAAIGKRVDDDNEQLRMGRGYDHNWVLEKNLKDKKEIRLAAVVSEPVSGRVMEVFTNEPGIQFYCGNFMNGKDVGKGKIPYNFRTAFCLETQHFPDSPNRDNFPLTILQPGEEYYSVCIYRFSVA